MSLGRIGRTEARLLEGLRERGFLHLTLLDPENAAPSEIAALARSAEEQGTSGIMIGGSTLYSSELMDECIRRIKEGVSVPVIIFPNNVNALSRYADAVFFMSLLNSLEWWFIMGAQVQGSFLVRQYGLEAIPMGYIVFGAGTAVAAVGRAYPIPPAQGRVAAGYALAAQYLGMRLVYLEAGSGAPAPLPRETVSTVKRVIDIPLMVGGGIRTPEQAEGVVEAGADIIVTGTIAERGVEVIGDIIAGAERGARRRGT